METFNLDSNPNDATQRSISGFLLLWNTLDPARVLRNLSNAVWALISGGAAQFAKV